MINLPIKYGFALNRWRTSVMPHIEKEAGKPYLSRFRVIHLFEADYNFFLKFIYGRRLVRYADKMDLLNDQQWGSRPKRTTIDALFLSRLSRDITHQLKANSASMDNDATGCYDRIIVSLGMIACRRLGMPKTAIQAQTDALKFMKYAVKTVYGISDGNYQGTVLEPLFGTGQGSGASPAVWLSLVVVILNAYDEIANDGFAFTDPWNELTELWKVFAFVDDTSLGFTDYTGKSADEMIQTLEHLAQLWEKLLNTTGGALNLSKCFWSLQYWEWKQGRPILRATSYLDSDLVMYSGDKGEASLVTRIENDESTKMLGVYANFNGTFGVHAQVMKLKMDGMAARLEASKLSKLSSKRFYEFYYLPSTRYSLPVTSMTNTELRGIQTKFKCATLNKLGFPYTYPNGVTFAPRRLFGVGLIDLRIDQGVYGIKALLDFVGTDQKAGNCMLISLRHLQLESGVSYHLFERTKTKLSYVTQHCWIHRLREFCGEHGISIYIKAARRPLATRQGDMFIMERAMQMNLKQAELLDVNLVRIYLRITTVSDASNAVGTELEKSVWDVEPFSDRTSKLTWPRQERPTVKQRAVWRKALRSFLVGNRYGKSGDLQVRLGRWIHPSNMLWKSQIHHNQLFVQHNQRVLVHEKTLQGPLRPSKPTSSIQSGMYKKEPFSMVTEMPKMSLPASVRIGSCILTNMAVLEAPMTPEPSVPGKFKAWLDKLPPAEHRLVHFWNKLSPTASNEIARHLVNPDGLLHVGSDGGKKRNGGAFAWLLMNRGHWPLWRCAGPVDGWHRCQSSLRSELMAIASFCLALTEFCLFKNIAIKCKITIVIDNLTAIKRLNQIRVGIDVRQYLANADALSIIAACPDVVECLLPAHVKSHQDKKTHPSKLPHAARTNILCDRLYTIYLDNIIAGKWGTSTCSSSPNYAAN